MHLDRVVFPFQDVLPKRIALRVAPLWVLRRRNSTEGLQAKTEICNI